MVRETGAAERGSRNCCRAEGLAMDVANTPSIRRVRVAALLAGAALPLVVALPASAAPYPLPGIGTVTFAAPAVEPVPDAPATSLEEGARCRSGAAALALGLRDAGMSSQGARYLDYQLAEACEEQAEARDPGGGNPGTSP